MYVLIKSPNGEFIERIDVVGSYETEAEAREAMVSDAVESGKGHDRIYRSNDGCLRTFADDGSATEWVILSV